jgi:hypothetical protein
VYLPLPLNPTKTGKKQIRKPSEGVPVIVFVSGGAWIIGYKLWSALMARELARLGYVVIVPDYRNFPQGNITHMIEDIRAALLWTVCNASMFGGDPTKITLAGQSAGAHIGLCVIVKLYEENRSRLKRLHSSHKSTGGLDQHSNIHAVPDDCSNDSASHSHTNNNNSSNSSYSSTHSQAGEESGHAPECLIESNNSIQHNEHNATTQLLPKEENLLGNMSYSATTISETAFEHIDESHHELHITDIKMFIGVSGPYNLIQLENHFHSRGLDSTIMEYICNNHVEKYSPTIQIAKLAGIITNENIREYSQKVNKSPDFLPKKSTFSSDGSIDSQVESQCSHDALCNCQHRDKRNENSETHIDLKGFPEVALFHGSKDKSIPTEICTELNDILTMAKTKVSLFVYKHWGHTDAILEGLLEGDTLLVDDMSELIQSSAAIWGTEKVIEKSDFNPEISTFSSKKILCKLPERNGTAPVMVNSTSLSLARILNPF